MLFFVVYVVVIGILVLAAYVGVRSGMIQRFLGMYPWVPKLLVMGYVVFAGCVVFPISSEPFPLDFQKGYLLVCSYGVIALAWAGVWGPGRGRLVYGAVFGLTAAGVGCRYLLEYGEVSNVYNFTPFNVVCYLAVVPTGTLIAYCWIVRKLRRR